MGEIAKGSIKEREISLLNLIVDILLSWRVIIVLMIIGGVLFAGMSYVQSYRAVQAQRVKLQQLEEELKTNEDVEEADKYWFEEQLSDTQIDNVKAAVEYEQMYEDKLRYQQNTFLMNVDPFNVVKGEITLLIRSDNMEHTYNIQKVYEDIATSTGLYDYLDKECNLFFSASQVVGLERTSYDLMDGSDTVRIAVFYNDEEQCQQIVDALIVYLKEQRELLTEDLGEHELIVLTQSVGRVVVADYAVAQKNCTTEIMSLRSSVVKTKDDFSDDEWRYYNYLTTGKAIENADMEETGKAEATTEESILSTETIAEPGINFKYVILGMILFAFIYVFYVFIKYILNNKLRSTESLTDIYNLSQLGFIPTIANKKKFLGFIDAWILSLRNRNKRKFTAEEAVNMAAVAVKMAVKKVSASDVYLVGCDIKNQTADVCEKIKNILSKDGIEVKMLDNVLYNAEAMVGLENAHCVVLVEKAGSTLYTEIVKELELLARQDIVVLGGIIVG